MTVKLVAVTQPCVDAEGGPQTADELIAYAARVSNPDNQLNGASAGKLLRYCIDHEHWSVFETASMTMEIETTRAIATQIVRHRTFTFQEFSQRYAVADTDPEPQEARAPHPKNRQASSAEGVPAELVEWWDSEQRRVYGECTELYVRALECGIARECARFVLPLATPTRLYMTGNVRSWIHYIRLRSANGTQPEHAAIARAARDVFATQFPSVAAALGWDVSSV